MAEISGQTPGQAQRGFYNPEMQAKADQMVFDWEKGQALHAFSTEVQQGYGAEIASYADGGAIPNGNTFVSGRSRELNDLALKWKMTPEETEKYRKALAGVLDLHKKRVVEQMDAAALEAARGIAQTKMSVDGGDALDQEDVLYAVATYRLAQQTEGMPVYVRNQALRYYNRMVGRNEKGQLEANDPSLIAAVLDRVSERIDLGRITDERGAIGFLVQNNISPTSDMRERVKLLLNAEKGLVNPAVLKAACRDLGYEDVPPGFTAFVRMVVRNKNAEKIAGDPAYIRSLLSMYASGRAYQPSGRWFSDKKSHVESSDPNKHGLAGASKLKGAWLSERQLLTIFHTAAENGYLRRDGTGKVILELPYRGGIHYVAVDISTGKLGEDQDAAGEALAQALGFRRVKAKDEIRYYFR